MNACTLHKLIEQIEDKTVLIFHEINNTHESAYNFINKVQTTAPKAMCFNVGNALIVEQYKQIPELFKLPYEVCWFEGVYEFEGNYIKVGWFCYQKNEVIEIQVYVLNESGKWYLKQVFNVPDNQAYKDKMLVSQYYLCDKSFEYIRWLSAFLSALNCCNINRAKTTPDEKLQRARAKRGKKPLFEFWTLEIDLERSEKEDCDWGGTHASPRFHLRRGHARQHKQGHWCWVRACAVGNKQSGGMIHKEYAAI